MPGCQRRFAVESDSVCTTHLPQQALHRHREPLCAGHRDAIPPLQYTNSLAARAAGCPPHPEIDPAPLPPLKWRDLAPWCSRGARPTPRSPSSVGCCPNVCRCPAAKQSPLPPPAPCPLPPVPCPRLANQFWGAASKATDLTAALLNLGRWVAHCRATSPIHGLSSSPANGRTSPPSALTCGTPGSYPPHPRYRCCKRLHQFAYSVFHLPSDPPLPLFYRLFSQRNMRAIRRWGQKGSVASPTPRGGLAAVAGNAGSPRCGIPSATSPPRTASPRTAARSSRSATRSRSSRRCGRSARRLPGARTTSISSRPSSRTSLPSRSR